MSETNRDKAEQLGRLTPERRAEIEYTMGDMITVRDLLAEIDALQPDELQAQEIASLRQQLQLAAKDRAGAKAGDYLHDLSTRAESPSIDIDDTQIPDGWEVIAIRNPVEGDYFLAGTSKAPAMQAYSDWHDAPRVILQRVEGQEYGRV